MSERGHFDALCRMYLSAPINQIYLPSIEVSNASATIEMDVAPQLFHPAGALHGSVYFKMLDDAAFFAVNSLEPEMFVLTRSFTTHLLRPISEGRIRSVGEVVDGTGPRYHAQATLYDASGERVAHGDGLFVRSRIRLADAIGYESGS